MTNPLFPTPAPFDPELVREIAADYAGTRGPLVPVLHALNDQLGYIDDRAIPVVAEALSLSIEEVTAIVSLGKLQLDWAIGRRREQPAIEE